MKQLLAIAALALLAGCYSTPVVLVNDRGEERTCGPYKNNDLQSAGAAIVETKCVDDYKEQGFRRK